MRSSNAKMVMRWTTCLGFLGDRSQTETLSRLQINVSSLLSRVLSIVPATVRRKLHVQHSGTAHRYSKSAHQHSPRRPARRPRDTQQTASPQIPTSLSLAAKFPMSLHNRYSPIARQARVFNILQCAVMQYVSRRRVSCYSSEEQGAGIRRAARRSSRG